MVLNQTTQHRYNTARVIKRLARSQPLADARGTVPMRQLSGGLGKRRVITCMKISIMCAEYRTSAERTQLKRKKTATDVKNSCETPPNNFRSSRSFYFAGAPLAPDLTVARGYGFFLAGALPLAGSDFGGCRLLPTTRSFNTALTSGTRPSLSGALSRNFWKVFADSWNLATLA